MLKVNIINGTQKKEKKKCSFFENSLGRKVKVMVFSSSAYVEKIKMLSIGKVLRINAM